MFPYLEFFSHALSFIIGFLDLFDGTKFQYSFEKSYSVLLTTQKSSVLYEYKSHCDSRYVGQTFQRLQDCIKQHVP